MFAGRIHPTRCVTLVCDLQERFRPLIHNFNTILNRSQLLIEASRTLSIPIVFAEQNPSKLGQVVPELGYNPAVDMKIEKMSFSMFNSMVYDRIVSIPHSFPSEKKVIILCGIETHVCVYQTALDILASDLNVELFIACDAVSSQRSYERRIALDDLQRRGANLITVESLIFRMLGTADSAVCPQFRTISSLLKRHNEANTVWFE